MSEYGVLNKHEIDLLRSLGITDDLDLAEEALNDLDRDYTTARMYRHAREALEFRAYVMAAAGAISRFEAIARALGSRSWQPLDVMVKAALTCGRADVAAQVLDAADVPGFHQEWVLRRRAGLR